MTDTLASPETIQAYLRGRLSPLDSRAFEERLPRDPALVKALEETLRLREGLEILRERGELARLVRGPRRVASYWAFAAALAAGVASVAIFLGYQFLARAPIVAASVDAVTGKAGATAPLTAHYTFAAMRQASATTDLDLPASGIVEIRVLAAGVDEAGTYRATLSIVPETVPAATVGTAAHLKPDPDGFVTFYADAARLTAGDYALAVAAEAGSATPGAPFRFRLRRPAADPRP